MINLQVRNVGIMATYKIKIRLKKIMPALLNISSASSPICQYNMPIKKAIQTWRVRRIVVRICVSRKELNARFIDLLRNH